MVLLIVKLGTGTSTRLTNGHFSTQWFMNRAAPNRVQVWSPTQEASEEDIHRMDTKDKLKLEQLPCPDYNRRNSRQLTQGLVTCLKCARLQVCFLSTSSSQESDMSWISVCLGGTRALEIPFLKGSGVVIVIVLVLGHTLDLFLKIFVARILPLEGRRTVGIPCLQDILKVLQWL